MTISLKHAFQSAKADSGDAALVQPSNWNEEHDLTGDAGTLLGFDGESGDATPVTVGSGLSLSGGTLSASGGGGLPLQLPIRDGRYYTNPLMQYPTSDSFTWANWDGYMVAIPFVAVDTKTWTRIGVNISTSDAAAVARLGIYSDNNGAPGSLLADAGEISAAATGAVEATISQELAGGTWYWLAMLVSGSTAAAYGIDNSARTIPLVAFVFGTGASLLDNNIGSYASQSYGALPASFPSPTEYAEMPYIWLRTGV